MRNPDILKFGGTSVGDAPAIERAANLVASRPEPAVIVVSALAGTTDALCRAARNADVTCLEPVLEHHRRTAIELLPVGRASGYARFVDAVAAEIRRDVATASRDAFLTHGELLAATLFSEVLDHRGTPALCCDARELIITDSSSGSAVPLADVIRARADKLRTVLARGRHAVLGGFVATNIDGTTTNLGRGGSDHTAALLGAALDAREVQIWTDVPGVMSADPRIVPAARTVSELSYEEAAELAYFGAKVLHPETIRPAREAGIPLRILSTREPTHDGTRVGPAAGRARGTIKAIATRGGVTVVQVTSGRMLGAHGFLRALFEVFERHRTIVDVVTTSEVSVSLTIDDTATLPQIIADLEPLGRVTVERDRAILCVVGGGMRGTPGVAARVFAAIGDINVSLVSQGASQVNLTFVVESAVAETAVRRIHDGVIAHECASVPTDARVMA